MAGARSWARWHRLRWLVFGLALAWVLWLGISFVLGALQLSDGLHAFDAARAHLQPADLVGGRAVPDLDRAGADLASAHRHLSGPAWEPVRLLPFVGRQLRSLSDLTGAAQRVSVVGAGAVSEVHRLLQAGAPAAGDRAGLVRQLGDLAGRTERQLSALRLGPRVGLVPALARRYNDFASKLDQLRSGLTRGSQAATVVADLLAGPRRYLVFAANNGEMRAGSGMFLSVGELDTGDGEITLGPLTTVTDVAIPPGAAPLSGDMAARWGWLQPDQDWRNLMLSPRFDASAALAAQMWEAAGHPAVNGVLVLDPVAVKALLQATGPVDVGGVTISADTVVQELLHDQYARFPTLSDKQQRREELGDIASATFASLDSGRPSLATLVSGLGEAARGRHLLAWSSSPAEEAGWVAAGVGGELAPDSLVLSVLNRAGNKLDQFLDVSADLSLRRAGADTEGTLTVHVKNGVPPGEPSYIAVPDPDSGLPPDFYLGIVTANLPGDARDAQIQGVDQLAVAGADGPTRVVGFQFGLAAGEQRTIVVTFRLPGHAGTMTVEPTARIPGVAWSSGTTRWTDGGSHNLPWHS